MDFSKLNEPAWGDYHNQLGGWLQRLFDPNFQAVLMEAYKWKHPGMKRYSDSSSMSLEDLMQINPRYRNVLSTQYKNSINLLEDLGLPPTGDSMREELKSDHIRRRNNYNSLMDFGL